MKGRFSVLITLVEELSSEIYMNVGIHIDGEVNLMFAKSDLTSFSLITPPTHIRPGGFPLPLT